MLLCLAEISLFTCTDLFFSSLAMSVSDISGDILFMTITKSEVGLFRASRKVALPNFSFSRRLRLCSSAGKRSGSFPAVLLRPLITMLCPSFSRFMSLSVSFKYTELSPCATTGPGFGCLAFFPLERAFFYLGDTQVPSLRALVFVSPVTSMSV